MRAGRKDRALAREYIRTEYVKLYLLDRREKTPEVRARMRFLADKYQSLI